MADNGDERDDRDDRLIADNIRRIRKAAGMSQGQLAEAMRERGQKHWRQTTVSRIENATQTLTMGEHRDLEAILGPEVIKGTSLQKSLRKFGTAVTDAAIKYRVRRLEDALGEATAALEDLREMLDVTHGGQADVEHPEA